MITEEGAEESEVFLILDGVVSVDVNGELLAELGPGALLGERALLEGGREPRHYGPSRAPNLPLSLAIISTAMRLPN